MASLDGDDVDGEAERLPPADLRRVVDLGDQCKLCYIHCPYTPPHRWAVDFPRHMLHARRADARAGGMTRRGPRPRPTRSRLDVWGRRQRPSRTGPGRSGPTGPSSRPCWASKAPGTSRDSSGRPSAGGSGRALHHLPGRGPRARGGSRRRLGSAKQRDRGLPACPALLWDAPSRRGRWGGGPSADRRQREDPE